MATNFRAHDHIKVQSEPYTLRTEVIILRIMPWIKEHGPQPGQSVSSLDIYTSDAHAQRCSSCDIARTYNTTQSPIASYAAATYLHEGNNSKNNLHEQVLAPTSAATSISTILSNDDFDGDHLPFQVPEYDIQHMNPWVMAATPGEFADHFPSLRKMSVKHDDMTDDGNMNLRVDTTISASTRRYHDITLFHLRMYDLKNRDFSFRRYCRDSGKEICRSKRKSSKTPKMGRPMLQRSLSNALSSLRSTLSSPKCQNNSHTQSFDFEEEDESALPSVQTTEGRVTRPSDTITVEFANYAHLEVKQRRARSPKYGFKYWGTEYSWKRARIQSGSFDEISYHLVDLSSHASVAHIVPVPLSDAEAREEQVKGG